MGMYDTVLIECRCGLVIGKQSKAGDCELKEYFGSDIPKKIAKSIDGALIYCNSCATRYRLHIFKTKIYKVTLEKQ